jgi:hypothetical protein
VRSGARVVTDPDAKVLDLEGVLLVDLVERDNLAVGLLDLTELHEEVPEARLGNDIVGGKDAHAVQFGRRVGLGGQMAPDDLVLLETTCTSSSSVEWFKNNKRRSFNPISREVACFLHPDGSSSLKWPGRRDD